MAVESNNMYDYLQQTISKAMTAPELLEDVNDGLEGNAYRKALVKAYVHDTKKTLLCGAGFVITGIHCFIMLILYIRGIASLNTGYVSGNIIYYAIAAGLPFVVWAYSTNEEYWNFHNRKKRTFYFCIFHMGMELASIVFRILGAFLIPFFAGIIPAGAMTPSMIRSFARLSLILPIIFMMIFIMSVAAKTFSSPMIEERFLAFKLNNFMDMRSADEKEFAYDMNIVKDLKTGEPHVIKESDRFLHSAANGTTGSGKTSGCFTCAIESDIEQIAYNLEYQKKKVQEYLKDVRIRMKAPMEDIDFDIDNFEPISEKDKDLLTALKFKAKIAGITTMAPGAAFSDEIYSLAKAKGLKVNRLDPVLDPSTGRLKEGFRGFNPLYMKDNLSPINRIIKMNQCAVTFADVAQAVYDATGQTDVYFAGLNKNITTTVTMLVLLTFPYRPEKSGLQPTAEDVQAILNDFSKAKPLLNLMVEHYAKKDKNGNVKDIMNPDLGMYQPIYDVVKNDLLGEGQKQLFDQCRGLRNIINSFLQNPLVKNILCSQDSIDLDEVLEKGQITVVNYALEMGTDATVFGLFVMLSLINAAYRRPGGEIKKLPHFFYVDEFPVLLHPRVEGCFSLFRQYRVAMFVAIQSLTQMEKSKSTAFLKDVLLGNCAHHFVFGRAAAQEMELYQTLGGESFQSTHMEGTKTTSILSDNPTTMTDIRDTIERKANITATDVRYRQFQEVTVVTVDNGNAVDMFLGKVSFLPSYRRLKKKRYSVDWSAYAELPKASGGEVATQSVIENSPAKGSVSFRSEIAADTFHEKGTSVTNTQPEHEKGSEKVIMFSAGDGNTPNGEDGSSSASPPSRGEPPDFNEPEPIHQDPQDDTSISSADSTDPAEDDPEVDILSLFRDAKNAADRYSKEKDAGITTAATNVSSVKKTLSAQDKYEEAKISDDNVPSASLSATQNSPRSGSKSNERRNEPSNEKTAKTAKYEGPLNL